MPGSRGQPAIDLLAMARKQEWWAAGAGSLAVCAVWVDPFGRYELLPMNWFAGVFYVVGSVAVGVAAVLLMLHTAEAGRKWLAAGIVAFTAAVPPYLATSFSVFPVPTFRGAAVMLIGAIFALVPIAFAAVAYGLAGAASDKRREEWGRQYAARAEEWARLSRRPIRPVASETDQTRTET